MAMLPGGVRYTVQERGPRDGFRKTIVCGDAAGVPVGADGGGWLFDATAEESADCKYGATLSNKSASDIPCYRNGLDRQGENNLWFTGSA